MTDEAAKSPTASMPRLRKRFPRAWAILQYGKSLLSLYRAMRVEDDAESIKILKDFLRAQRSVAESFEKEARESSSPKLRAQARAIQSWAFSNVSAGIGFLATAGVGPDAFTQEELAETIRLGERALDAFEQEERERASIAGKKRKGLFAWAGEAERSGRLALLQVNLGTAYLHFHEGDMSQNLEMALGYYEKGVASLAAHNMHEFAAYARAQVAKALLVFPTDHPRVYAKRAIAHLASAKEALAPYASIPKKLKESKEASENRSFLSLAPGFFWALFRSKIWKVMLRGGPSKVLLRTMEPGFVADLDWCLGIAYRRLRETQRAVEHFDLALESLPNNYCDERGAILLAKGLTYLEAENGNREERLSCALQSLNGAMEESEEDSAPEIIAEFHHIRACLEPEAMAAVKPEDQNQDLAKQRDRLLKVAKQAKNHGLGRVHQEALMLLGRTNILRGDLARGYGALVNACKIAEGLHAHARTPRLKSYLVGTRTHLYDLLVGTALAYAEELARSTEKPQAECDKIRKSALVFGERARTRFLAEQLSSKALAPQGASSKELEPLWNLRRLWIQAELKDLELEASAENLPNPQFVEAMRQRRNAVESSYQNELKRVREKFGDPTFDPDRPVSPIEFAEISSMVGLLSAERETALVEYFITDRTLVAFVVLAMRDSEASLVCVDTGLSRQKLNELEERWSDGLAKLQQNPQQVVHWERGYLGQVLDELRAVVEAPVRAIEAWERETQRRVSRVIVMPHRFLHLVPLHAVCLPDGSRWGESFSIQYAPSASVLWRLAHRGDAPGTKPVGSSGRVNNGRVLAVAYSAPSASAGPRSFLPFNVCEAHSVAALMGGEVIEGPEATPCRVVEAMLDATYVHFACHGAFNSEAPLETGLELAPEKACPLPENGCSAVHGHAMRNAEQPQAGRLTLGRIFERVHLPHTELVVLSACETGIPKVEEDRDECIGLPAGFLFAGAKTVVSTLWPVSDVATWLLMRRMARSLASNVSPPDALRLAQHALRQLEACQIAKEIDEAAAREDDLERREHMLEESRHMRDRAKSEPYPYATPYWWAGFTVNGLG